MSQPGCAPRKTGRIARTAIDHRWSGRSIPEIDSRLTVLTPANRAGARLRRHHARFSLLTSRFSVPSSHFPLLTSHFSVLGSQSPVLTSHFSVLGSQSPVLTSHFSVLGSQSPVLTSHFSVLTSRFSVPGSWFLVLGSRFSVPGSWFLVLTHPTLRPGRRRALLPPLPVAALLHRVRRRRPTRRGHRVSWQTRRGALLPARRSCLPCDAP